LLDRGTIHPHYGKGRGYVSELSLKISCYLPNELFSVREVPENKVLFARGVPANKFLKAGGVPANEFLKAGGVPANKLLKAGGVPANNPFQKNMPPSRKFGCSHKAPQVPVYSFYLNLYIYKFKKTISDCEYIIFLCS
jgi:hypothetical protein